MPGIPLTHRDHAQACVFVTGHSRGDGLSLGWTALIQPRQTVVIFMGLGKLSGLMQEFVAHGGDPKLPAAIIDNGTRPNQRVVTGTVETIADLATKADLHGPALIILGTVVSLARQACTGRGRHGRRGRVVFQRIRASIASIIGLRTAKRRLQHNSCANAQFVLFPKPSF